jgi:glycosyltransferase involved in cell wall biosynthesis
VISVKHPGQASADKARSAPVSLVIPVRNEESSLTALIASIAEQTCQPDEILLVDGGSSDRTVELARHQLKDKPRYRVIEAGTATPGRGRNLGIAAASNEWIALTDAGIRLEPDWLERLIEVAERESSVEVIYGNYEPVTETFFAKCASLVYVPPKLHRPGGLMRGPSIASSLIRREVWEAAGGFPDLRAAEDLIFMRRIEELGFKTGWAPQATVWWQLRPDLSSTFRKFVLYSRHNVLAGQQRYWHYGLVRYYLLSLPFVIAGLWHSYWWLAIPLLIFLARVAKNIFIRRENRSLLRLLNPAQFVTVAFIQAVIELATFIGWGQAIWQKRSVAASTVPDKSEPMSDKNNSTAVYK